MEVAELEAHDIQSVSSTSDSGSSNSAGPSGSSSSSSSSSTPDSDGDVQEAGPSESAEGAALVAEAPPPPAPLELPAPSSSSGRGRLADSTTFWKGFKITERGSGFEITCYCPGHLEATKCCRTMNFGAKRSVDEVLRCLKWWALQGPHYATRHDHVRLCPKEPPEGLPSTAELEACPAPGGPA